MRFITVAPALFEYIMLTIVNSEQKAKIVKTPTATILMASTVGNATAGKPKITIGNIYAADNTKLNAATVIKFAK